MTHMETISFVMTQMLKKQYNGRMSVFFARIPINIVEKKCCIGYTDTRNSTKIVL